MIDWIKRMVCRIIGHRWEVHHVRDHEWKYIKTAALCLRCPERIDYENESEAGPITRR